MAWHAIYGNGRGGGGVEAGLSSEGTRHTADDQEEARVGQTLVQIVFATFLLFVHKMCLQKWPQEKYMWILRK